MCIRDSWSILHEPAVSPMMNAALDEALTNAVGEGRRGPTLRIWEWDEPAVIIGSFQSVVNEVDEDQLAARGAQLVRRVSGGGAMYMEPANSITYALYALSLIHISPAPARRARRSRR